MQIKQTSANQTLTWWIDVLFLSVTLGCLFFILLGDRPLFVPDEGRYAEIAREMVASHDWVTPTLNGITYFEKPILFYWLGAIAIKLGGVSIFSLRCINALLGLMGCLLTYAWARSYFDRATGLLAAGILATTSLYFVMSHMITLDLPVTVFNTATLMGCLFAYDAKTPRASATALWLAAVSAALAVLTKGLIGLVFPGLILLTYITLTHGWRRLWQLPIISSVFVFLLIAAPWHVIVNHRHPDFFYFYFIEQHFLRYTSKDIGHYQPIWFFIPTLLAGLFPWVVFLPQTLIHGLKKCFAHRSPAGVTLYLLLSVFIIFTFFSFSKSKLIPYLLPLFPPLAILMADALRTTSLKAGLVSLIALAAGMLLTTMHLLRDAVLPDPTAAAHTLTLALSFLILGAFFSLLLMKKNKSTALITFVVTAAIFLTTAFSAFPDMDTRTILPLARLLTPVLKPKDDVITYDQYYQDLPFYLQRRITILNWRNELTNGMLHQDTKTWMINDAEFWKRWKSSQRVFVFINLSELEKLKAKKPDLHASILGETLNTALISNQPN